MTNRIFVLGMVLFLAACISHPEPWVPTGDVAGQGTDSNSTDVTGTVCDGGACCTPNCEERNCGDDGCGGSCGTCFSPDGAVDNSLCVEGVCMCKPACEGKECGDDGCGGNCGACIGEGEVCVENQCGTCDPVANAGCPDGHYCTYVANDGPLCETAGTQKYGEPCGGFDTCSEGICIEVASSESGPLCYRICDTHVECGEASCLELLSSPFKVCAEPSSQETCNLLDQDCSLDTDGCYFDQDAGEPVCLTAGNGEKEGDACSGEPNDCAEGLVCLSLSGSGWECRKFCNTQKGKEPSCNANGPFPKCSNYFAKQMAGYCKAD